MAEVQKVTIEKTEEVSKCGNNIWKDKEGNMYIPYDPNKKPKEESEEKPKEEPKPETKEIEIQVSKQEKEDPVECLLCAVMNALGHRKHALSEIIPSKLADMFGGDAEIIVSIGGPEIAYKEDTVEDMLKDILPMISSTKKYEIEDIQDIRKNKNKQGASMKKLLSLMSDGNILKAFNGMQMFKAGGQLDGKKTVEIGIEDKKYNLYEAKTDEEKKQGLMGVEHLKDNEGMIFYYDKPQKVSMWMKDTKIPLTICFFDEDGECISVRQGHPLNEQLISEDDVMFVVELNENADVKEGDELDLPGDDDEYVMQILGSDGTVQHQLKGGERICSRRESAILIRKAKRAYSAKRDDSYENKCRTLGKYIFKVWDKQDNRDPEYVQLDKKE